ncbi:helix-turn-helix domain-containing protein [Pedobacter sp. HMF7647]|uniref:Helix-turn-helix domain-containing protein n=1 Tax=Hufsiella arboris TaxID=2695275 RepID=A0A7K1Y9D3_9SPHI|nr:AraC family transcriptional regulator [Hufsiella arboris]MXV51030.1 helix-turn-helix domain-containing protein [Hufsiella arboris]
MPGTESLEDFYKNKGIPVPLCDVTGNFSVFKVEAKPVSHKQPVRYARREYYKISLSRGHNIYHYADKSLEVSGTTLLFFNPHVPYTFEHLGDADTSYFCIFKEEFFSEHLRGSLKELPMYALGGKPAYSLNAEQDEKVAQIFEKMLEEVQSDYRFKYDMIRNFIMEIVHNALKLQPAENLYKHVDANSRLTAVFSELLERQFPIESTSQKFSLRSAKDFAGHLNVHVNHLNRAIKLSTGKTTTNHIADRLLIEAKALLKHTDWNISEISYCLGFEEPAHFNHFFKKQTSSTPSAFRV